MPEKKLDKIEVKLPIELKRKFKAICELRKQTMSETLLKHIEEVVQRYEP